MEQVQQTEKQNKSRFTTKTLAKVAVLTALSAILYIVPWLKFSLPMLFPSFLDIQFSELPALIGGFSMGPIAGCAIIVIKCLIKMPMTSTMCVGEIGDIIMGIAFVLPAALIYKNHKNIKGAVLGMLAGMASFVFVGIFVNWLVLIPFYAMFLDGGWNTIIGMVSTIYPGVTQQSFFTYYLFLGVLPFNLLRGILVSLLTFLLYKRVSPILHI